MKQKLPIGLDDFRKLRENDYYYVDKSMMINDFLESGRPVTLITRPRRFGKTLNMSMFREFFDITKDSAAIFHGLFVMKTPYASQINTKPVVYLTFKDSHGTNSTQCKDSLIDALFPAYQKYYDLFTDFADPQDSHYVRFYQTFHELLHSNISWSRLKRSILCLLETVKTFYGKLPLLLIDEYDQPLISAYQYGYREELSGFFESFYGQALKGNDSLDQALLTGIQRVVKESIFSNLNNVNVYTVLHDKYATYFGLTESESEKLLSDYGISINYEIKDMYNGYQFGNTAIYNPWSILNYVDEKKLIPYWVNTSANALIYQAIAKADARFYKQFDELIQSGSSELYAKLDTSFMELANTYTLWGLFINAGYLTVTAYNWDNGQMKVRIPNQEVFSEFRMIVAEQTRIGEVDLQKMFNCLICGDMKGFLALYETIVLTCTSYHDARENAYHMLFLGMCVSLRKIYRITSNLECGDGRSDITMESLSAQRPHFVFEFKQGKDLNQLKKEALDQILAQRYYAPLSGEVVCVGIAHDMKRCAMVYQKIEVESGR
ncbi:MAG: ATP-binding protein [Lachnospiraceae bacterium]|jgi:hypothetical protein|nr:ATP-binding protein [Lachnospiraceae bacterium]